MTDPQLVSDVRSGLGSYPKSLAPRWLYDDAGIILFDEITRLPEYYLTEAERRLLDAHAAEVAKLSGARSIVELGAGTADKTMTLLQAFADAGRLTSFVPLDVSTQALDLAAQRVRERFPRLPVVPHIADFSGYLPPAEDDDPRLVAFLGSTIGNFYADERRAFLEHVAASLRPGDSLLLGTDLVKGADRLVRAYNDSQGVTERFVLNLLRVLNRELGAEFRIEDFDYAPLWDERQERMDLRLRSRRAHDVPVPGADMTVPFAAGEEIRVEISTKFRLAGIARELSDVGLEPVQAFADADFGLTLALQDQEPENGDQGQGRTADLPIFKPSRTSAVI